MLSFDDDFTALARSRRRLRPPARARPRRGGCCRHGSAREPVHDLDAEQQAMQNGFQRVRVEDKRVINGQADVNQLVPFKYTLGVGQVPCRLREPLDAAGRSTCSATSSCGRTRTASPTTSA